MSFNFKSPLQKVNLPTLNYAINYRAIVASLLFLTAVLLLLSSCTKEASSPSIIPTASPTISSPVAPNTQAYKPVTSQTATPQRGATTREPRQQHYTMSSVDYYLKNYYFAEDRIKLNKEVAIFIKYPPTKSNPGYYKRYHKVKADYHKARKYREKLEQLENKHAGRNRILSDLKAKKRDYLEIEAKLYYQLEKIVYFAEQSYYQWQVFESYDPTHLTKFEKISLLKSEQTAKLFQDFSNAVAHYTNARR